MTKCGAVFLFSYNLHVLVYSLFVIATIFGVLQIIRTSYVISMFISVHWSIVGYILVNAR